MSNPVWTEIDRARYRRSMARRNDSIIAELPNGRLVYESDLDVRLKERVGVVVAYLLVAALVVAAIVAPLAIGGLIATLLGWKA